MKNVVYLKLNENNFYEAYNDDAFVVAYIMKYKLVSFGNGEVKIGFPDDLLSEVISFLKKNKISYVVSDNPKLSYDFGKYNQYLRFLKKDISIDRTYNPYLKKYKGTFSIIFEDEKEIEEFEIGKNINESAELVSKAFNNDVNSIVKLNSGLSLKLLIRILNINNILK